MGRAALQRKSNRTKSRTQRYYDTHPEHNRIRLKQQTAYNQNGSSKPGTKNITGNEITRRANKLRALLIRTGRMKPGSKQDAGHGDGEGGGGPQNQHENRSRIKRRRRR